MAARLIAGWRAACELFWRGVLLVAVGGIERDLGSCEFSSEVGGVVEAREQFLFDGDRVAVGWRGTLDDRVEGSRRSCSARHSADVAPDPGK